MKGIKGIKKWPKGQSPKIRPFLESEIWNVEFEMGFSHPFHPFYPCKIDFKAVPCKQGCKGKQGEGVVADRLKALTGYPTQRSQSSRRKTVTLT